jgi:quercetin dioxygenase-like cupin family protein
LTDTIALGGGTTVRVVAARDEATLLELALEPGAGAGPHTHIREDETMAVLAGRLLVDDGERHDLGPGDAIVLPRGVRHAFANEATRPCGPMSFARPADWSASSAK